MTKKALHDVVVIQCITILFLGAFFIIRFLISLRRLWFSGETLPGVVELAEVRLPSGVAGVSLKKVDLNFFRSRNCVKCSGLVNDAAKFGTKLFSSG